MAGKDEEQRLGEAQARSRQALSSTLTALVVSRDLSAGAGALHPGDMGL